MTQTNTIAARFLTVSGLGLILILLALVALQGMSAPAQANDSVPVAPKPAALPPAKPPAQTGDLTISKNATTEADPANGASVFAGGVITYEVTIQNTSPTSDVTNIDITDQLPVDSLTNIECLDSTPAGLSCTILQKTEVFTTKTSGGGVQTTTILVDDKVQWTLSQLGPGQSATGRFRGRVACQSAGQSFSNFAFVNFTGTQGLASVQFSNQVNTLIQADVPNANGQPSVSRSPTFCSTDTGGFYDMDWGDYDADGDLDLLLLSGNPTIGAVVYKNEENQFARISVYARSRLQSARWGDFNNDGRLDILVTGYWDSDDNSGPNGSYPYTGYNHVFLNDGGDNFNLVSNDTDGSGLGYTFQSNDGANRSAVINYNNGANRVDVALGNEYDITNGCAIQVNRNIGAPNYFVAQLNSTTDWDNVSVFCLLEEARVRGLAWGDYNNDGWPDLAASVNEIFGGLSDRVLVFTNNSGSGFSLAFTISDFVGSSGPPYDVRWGDHNNDGWLDLAVALGGEVRIYNNSGGTVQNTAFKTFGSTIEPIYAIDWLDFDGDGQLELAVAGYGGKVRIYEVNSLSYTELPTAGGGAVFSVRGVDADNDGDLDIAYTNFFERAFLYTTDAGFLSQQLSVVHSASTSGVDVGDVSGGGLAGGQNDLLFAAGGGNKLYANNNGQFSAPFDFVIPSNDAAFGDVDGDGDLDVAAGTSSSNFVYLYNGVFAPAFNWSSTPQYDTRRLLLDDFNQDNSGFMELVAANNNNPATYYLNEGLLTTGSGPAWSSAEAESSRGIAAGYFNSDVMPDIAIANDGQPNRVYTYTGQHTFGRAGWNPSVANDASRGVAWGDYDGDGDMDLAVANYNQPNYVYQNQGGTLGSTPIWTSNEAFNSTSVAWGDWDNDGDLDLAFGNDSGDPDQVYANLGSTPGSPRLFWLWQSGSSNNTQDIAWGDIDGDGDLDLAAAGAQGGYYKNGYVSAGHLNVSNMPLPLNSTYLSIRRPVPPSGQVWYRPTLSDPSSLVIPVEFTVYDPDGSSQNGTRNNLSPVPGPYALSPQIEYSADGGGSWQSATFNSLSFNGGTDRYSVNWQAGDDLGGNNAASDDIRLRITIAHQNKQGLVQRAKSSAVSPPFRVRNLECVWPEDASITYQPAISITPGDPIEFKGSAVGGGDGVLGQVFFNWDFGEVMSQGWKMYHTYSMTGTYVVSLTVEGAPCPITRPDFVTTTVTVGITQPLIGPLTGTVFLPIVIKDGAGAISTSGGPIPEELPVNPQLSQITGLTGNVQPGGTLLQWNAGPPDEAILGYRVYRATAGTTGFQLLADVPGTSYTDSAATCGQSYFVTAYNAGGESLPSTASYFSPPCP